MATKVDLIDLLTSPDFKGDLSNTEVERVIKVIASTDTVTSKVVGSWYKIMAHQLRNFVDVDALNDHFYPLVKAACIKEGMTALERNRVTGFHRSAISTLRGAFDYNIAVIDTSNWPRPKSEVAKDIRDHIFSVKSSPIDKMFRKLDELNNAVDKLPASYLFDPLQIDKLDPEISRLRVALHDRGYVL